MTRKSQCGVEQKAGSFVMQDIPHRRQDDGLPVLREMALAEVSQGVLICDERQLIIYANAGFERLTGYSQAEVLGRKCSMLQGPETSQEMVRDLRAAIREGRVFEGVILNHRKDGTTFWNNLSITPVRDENGVIVRFIGIQRDVTEQRRVQHSVEEQAALLDKARDAVLVQDFDRRITYWNKSAELLYGWAEEEVMGRQVADRFFKEPAGYETVMSEVTRLGEWTGELRQVTRNGRELIVESRWTLVRDDNDQPGAVLVINTDITERKAAERSLLLTAQHMKLAARAGNVGIWDFDAESGVLTWDEQMFVLHGMKSDSATLGYDVWFSCLHPEDRDRVEAEFRNALGVEGNSFNTEFRILRKNDRAERVIRAISTIFHTPEGRFWRMIGTTWDITAERQRERSLADALERQRELTQAALAAEKAKIQFLAMMSHEIRTPMNGILGFTDMVLNDPTLSPEGHDCLESVARNGEALLRIIDDILDFSRIDTGNMVITKRPFSPSALVHDLEVLFSHQVAARGIQLDAGLDASLPPRLFGDDIRIRQILINLVGNAFKFTLQGSIYLGMRSLSVPEEPPQVEFEVRDTGIGISPDQMKLIFQPFTQIDSAITRRVGGTGLGLTISRRLAGLMGGSLEMESMEGQGTAFFLRLPLEASDPSPDLRDSPRLPDDLAPELPHPLRVLVAEDDRTNHKLIVMMFRRLGYEPVTVSDGAGAVQLAETGNFDIILMDVHMPGMDGIEATRAIRSREALLAGPPAFICALTANILPEDRDLCFAAGMNHYINKPVKIKTISEALVMASRFRSRRTGDEGKS